MMVLVWGLLWLESVLLLDESIIYPKEMEGDVLMLNTLHNRTLKKIMNDSRGVSRNFLRGRGGVCFKFFSKGANFRGLPRPT
jgi:hypothetical protein